MSIVKTGRWAGVVTAFITMSDIHDEIDWECEHFCRLICMRHHLSGYLGPGSNTTQAQTNWFWQGVIRESGYASGVIF